LQAFSYVQSAGAFASPGTHGAPGGAARGASASEAVSFGSFAGSLLVTRTTDLLRDARLQFFDRGPNRIAVADRALLGCPAHSASGLRGRASACACPATSRSRGSARPALDELRREPTPDAAPRLPRIRREPALSTRATGRRPRQAATASQRRRALPHGRGERQARQSDAAGVNRAPSFAFARRRA
jgi:hypothetical protein